MSLKVNLHNFQLPSKTGCFGPSFRLPPRFTVRISLHQKETGQFLKKLVKRRGCGRQTPATSAYENCDYVLPILSPEKINKSVNHEFNFNLPSLLQRFQNTILSVQVFRVEQYGYRLVAAGLSHLSRGRVSIDLPLYQPKLKQSICNISTFLVPELPDKPIKNTFLSLAMQLTSLDKSPAQSLPITMLTTRSQHPLLKEHVMRRTKFHCLKGAILLRNIPNSNKILICDGERIEVLTPDGNSLSSTNGRSKMTILDLKSENMENGHSINDIAVLDEETIVYAVNNKVFIKSLLIPDKRYNFNHLSIPVPIASLSLMKVNAKNSGNILVGGAFDGSLRIWDLNQPFQRREARFLNQTNPVGIMLLKVVNNHIYAVSLENIIYKVLIDAANFTMHMRAEFNNKNLTVRGMDVSEDIVLLLDHNLNALILDCNLTVLFGIRNPIIPGKSLPLPITPCIVDEENLLLPRLYGFDHVCLSAGHPSVSRYQTVTDEAELVRGVVACNAGSGQLYVGSYPSGSIFSTALPMTPLQHYRPMSAGTSTFVVKKQSGYQGVYDLPILLPDQKRAERRAKLLESEDSPQNLSLLMTY